MTFADLLRGLGGRDLVFEVQVAGLPLALSERVDLPASVSAPTVDGRGLIAKIAESKSTLDIYRRLQTGGGFVVELHDARDTLRPLFAPRSFRVAHVTANVDKTTTTIPVSSTALLPSSGVVYIAGESIAYTGTAATTLTGCTRGAFGSPALRHRGGTQQGASVYLSPPSYVGRRVTLRAYLMQEGVPLEEPETLGVYRLEEAPQDLGDGRWELRCSHLSDELAKRKLGSGLGDVDPRGALVEMDEDGGVPLLKIVGPAGFARRFTQGTYQTHAMVAVRTSGGTADVSAVSIFPVYDAAEDTPVAGVSTLRLQAAPLTQQGRGIVDLARYNGTGPVQAGLLPSAGRIEVDTISHLALLWRGVPHVLMTFALLSRNGDGDAGPYDVLGGVDPTTLGGGGFRLGAGMDPGELDVASLEALSAVIDPTWSTVIDEEIPLPEVIEDFCRRSNSAAVYGRDGRLRFRPLLEDRSAVVVNITEANVKGAIASSLLEDRVFARARLSANYSPLSGDYEATIDVIDEEVANSYPNAEQTIVLKSRSLMVAPVSGEADNVRSQLAVPVESLVPTLRRDMIKGQGGELVVSVVCDLSVALVELGDLVSLTLPVSDYRGGRLTAARARVIGREPRWDDGEVHLDLLVLEKLVHWAPAIVVEDFTVTNATLGVVTGDTGARSNPAGDLTDSLAVGDALHLYRPSTGGFFDHATNGYTVDGIGAADEFTVTHDVSAEIPQAGDVFVLASFGRAVASAAGFVDEDFAVHVPDGGTEPYGPGSSRWR